MAHLLQIDSSSRGDRSHSRRLTREFVIFELMGITDITLISVENDEYGGISLAQSIANAQTQMAQLIRG